MTEMVLVIAVTRMAPDFKETGGIWEVDHYRTGEGAAGGAPMLPATEPEYPQRGLQGQTLRQRAGSHALSALYRRGARTAAVAHRSGK